MTTLISNETLELRAPATLREVADIRCERCTFDNCNVPLPESVRSRLAIRRVALLRCKHHSSTIQGAILADVLVDHLTRTGTHPLFLFGCAFHHVTLRGPISYLLVKPHVVDFTSGRPRTEFFLANNTFYLQSDWALDISQAQFGGLVDFPGVPPNLVRRDSDSQVVVTSRKASFIVSAYPDSVWALVARDVMDLGVPGTVVALGKRSRKYALDLSLLRTLQEQGLVE
jgi:hypothetical protein